MPHSIDIVTIHDLGQSLETAWAFTPERDFESRPAPLPIPRVLISDAPETATKNRPIPLLEPPLLFINDTPKSATKNPLDGSNPFEASLGGEDANAIKQVAPGASRSTAQGSRYALNPDHEVNNTLMDRGKGKDNISKAPLINQTPAQARVQQPMATGASRKPGEDELSFDKNSKARNWLTDPTMLAGDLDQARILALSYPEPTQLPDYPSKKPDYNKCLKELLDDAATAILMRLKEKRTGSLSNTPLVLMGNGFGCLILQQLIALAIKDQEFPGILDSVATVIFFDAPTASSNENARLDSTAPVFPSVVISNRATKAFVESNTIDSWDLWMNFNNTIKEKEISTVWFYTPPLATNPTAGFPSAVGVEFVKIKPSLTKSTHSRPFSRFKGPSDPNYILLISRVTEGLLFKASSDKKLKDLLRQLIDLPCNLDVIDYTQRCPLHRAAACANDEALGQLVSARSDLATKGDKDGLTPLHVAIIKAIEDNPTGNRRESFQVMIKKLLSALTENQCPDDLKDNTGMSAWEYAWEDHHGWIRDLRGPQILLDGVRAARPETIQDLMEFVPVTADQETVCRRSEAILTQFYITEDASKDFLFRQRPSVYTVIYDQRYGVQKLFSRKFGNAKGKQATCRWIHLPANNEKWVHDVFVRQLRRIDKSTSLHRHRGPAPFDRHITPGIFRYNQACEPRARGTHLALPSSTMQSADPMVTTERPVTALFMPVFGFEKHENRIKLSSEMRAPSCQDTAETPSLISAYFRDDKFPLHCRRTLDQFTYHMLDDTENRDNTQVIFKWFERESRRKRTVQQQKPQLPLDRPTDNYSYPLLMVDQLWLWLWIVDDDEQTVITSLPNTWEPTEEYNLVRYLMEHKLMANNDRPVIEGPLDLVNSIVRCSIDFLHRKGPHNATLYECFQSSITVIAEDQALQFEDFNSVVKRLNIEEIKQHERATLTNELFQFSTETHLLTEILDIQDELKTIYQVLMKQEEVLDMFIELLSDERHEDGLGKDSNIMAGPKSSKYGLMADRDNTHSSRLFSTFGETKSREPASTCIPGDEPRVTLPVRFSDQPDLSTKAKSLALKSKSLNQAKANLNLVRTNIKLIKEMDMYAGKVQMEIKGLLDRKQRHANAWEARFAREASEHTQRQSDITIVFTIVTVLFLPLSFISSVFAIQINAFPHDPQTGEVNWPLREALGLIFGISSAVIILIAFVFRDTLISRFTERLNHITPVHREARRHNASNSGSIYRPTFRTTREGHQPGQSPAMFGQSSNQSSDVSPKYAPLFGRWLFHTRIPFIRMLWMYRSYADSERLSYQSSPNANFTDEVRLHPAAGLASFGREDCEWAYGLNQDYPLHRAQLLSASFLKERFTGLTSKLTPRRFRNKEKVEDYENSSGGNERSITIETENSCNRPLESWRRRKEYSTQQAMGNIAVSLLPWKWRGDVGGSALAPTITGSAVTSLNTANDLSKDDSVIGRKGVGAAGGAQNRSKKETRLAALLPFLERKKVKGEDLERGLGE
ncbi:hypothetical protein F5Y10DRAFT_230813 [Nemania abortiva]|nr:hypothetical protein F5Y10DRAFT_230813 [Nemania abortiva]